NTVNGAITINVVDDVPTAVADVNGIAANASGAVTGNVLSNDIPGADGHPSVTSVGSISLMYGSLTLDADGSYSYQLDTSNLAVMGLPKGSTLADAFTYTMQDGDGDPSQADLTITITGTNHTPTITVTPTNPVGGHNLV